MSTLFLAKIDGQIIFLALFMLFGFLRWLAGLISQRMAVRRELRRIEEERFRSPRQADPRTEPRREQVRPAPAQPRTEAPSPPARQAPQGSIADSLQEYLDQMSGAEETTRRPQPQRSEPAPTSVKVSPPPRPPATQPTPQPQRQRSTPPPAPVQSPASERIRSGPTPPALPTLPRENLLDAAHTGSRVRINARQAQKRERARKLREMISSQEGLRTAWIISEVIGKPKALE